MRLANLSIMTKTGTTRAANCSTSYRTSFTVFPESMVTEHQLLSLETKDFTPIAPRGPSNRWTLRTDNAYTAVIAEVMRWSCSLFLWPHKEQHSHSVFSRRKLRCYCPQTLGNNTRLHCDNARSVLLELTDREYTKLT